jgi:XRE family transcriptional regulator, regulator of sulfur utilization
MLCPHRVIHLPVDPASRKAFREKVTREFAANLKREREAAGLSQEELASEAGMNRTHVGYLERRRRTPQLATIRLLAEALGISAARLVDPPGPDPEQPRQGAVSGEESL